MIKQAIILAGGQGTRLRPFTNDMPKPMIRFHGKPFLQYLIEMLKDEGVEEIILLVGYLSEKIIEYFGSGEEFGVKIIYSISPIEYETGARIREVKHLVADEFLLMYCDNYWPLKINKIYENYVNLKKEAQITVYRNEDLYTKNNCKANINGVLEIYDKTKSNPELNCVDIGFFILKKEVINLLPEGNVSFENEVITRLVKEKNISAFITEHRYYSVGSIERLKLTEEFLRRTPVIILDRDGVLNKKAEKGEYITSVKEWKWIEKSLEAIGILYKMGYQIIIVTNQAGIGRGKMTEKDLEEIHNKMIADVENIGAKILDIFYCPHTWDEGCRCRKPQPGMLLNSQKKYNIDLSRTYFVGDDERDEIAGKLAGMKTHLVNDSNNLFEFVNWIRNENY
jgi:histidinol-phosphate phosphatase family protein